jgi:cytochrome b subunit of formate dehydrogenase
MLALRPYFVFNHRSRKILAATDVAQVSGQRTYAATRGRRSPQQRIMNKGYKMQSYKAILSALALSVAGSVLVVPEAAAVNRPAKAAAKNTKKAAPAAGKSASSTEKRR